MSPVSCSIFNELRLMTMKIRKMMKGRLLSDWRYTCTPWKLQFDTIAVLNKDLVRKQWNGVASGIEIRQRSLFFYQKKVFQVMKRYKILLCFEYFMKHRITLQSSRSKFFLHAYDHVREIELLFSVAQY